ncbi:MAG: DEAD/DEAH box helicase [Sideroxyarcus sp.]|nr:DEAD/DEAH box helicase [Sideroxyarcus sp.]
MLKVAYRLTDRKAALSWDVADEGTRWLSPLRRTLFDHSEEVTQEGSLALSLPWWTFLSARSEFNEILQGFQLKRHIDYDVEPEAERLLRDSQRKQASFEQAQHVQPISETQLLAKLAQMGFERPLTDKQIRNIGHIASLPAGATFSVPGAGKTTEALATFFYRAAPDERLLVIAPKNAFGAWDEQIADCVPSIEQKFTRLRGGREKIAKLLENAPRFMLITYQQLPRVRELIAAFLAQHKTHVYLDESHRIKSGAERQTPQAVLSISHLPVGKLIMSGTPMPQSEEDLLPQFFFLYPEIVANKSSVVELIRPIYVRTNKSELGLPDVTRRMISLDMAPVQSKLYHLMKFQVARDAETALTAHSKSAFRTLGRSVARLLQFVSNPALLSREIGFAHDELLAAVLAEGDSPKLRYVVRRARELAREGKKVLIWSSFVANVEILSQRLSDMGAVYIHGGVDAGDEDDDDTREGKIRLFHEDRNVRVMVANPAAASEGISLHTVCHNAIYLDRTFNSAHYLQSEDRIHRFGLKPGQETIIEIIECADTVDEAVRQRLGYKVAKMAEALEDSSLHIEPEPYDPPPSDDPIEDVVGALGVDDAQALINSILGKNG